MVVLVGSGVLSEILDALRQHRDLHLGGAGVGPSFVAYSVMICFFHVPASKGMDVPTPSHLVARCCRGMST